MQSNKEEFIERITIKQDKELQRILKLQKAYEKRLILEDEISEEDKEKLYNLYEMQIKEIQASIKVSEDAIERNKNDIIKIRDKLKYKK
ncbi:MAG: hypothetical protein HFJ18_02285 [Clostridia bacterium]|nr:hypothetical protein [Clostridia bacterium]